MIKIALMFPGQGSQRIGMGMDIYNKYQNARNVIDMAGNNLKDIIFNGPNEILKLNKYVQPAIFVVSMAIFEVFRSFCNFNDISFVAAGHSLGEYSALCAAGFFDFTDGLEMVKLRGEFMQKASDENSGAMVAIIGLKKTVVENICMQASSFGVCEIANFNSHDQIVISGNISSINIAIKLATDAGALKCITLNVSGPFHSSLMASASDNMSKKLCKYNFNIPSFGVFTNCDALLNTDNSFIKKKLVKQIVSPVKWNETINNIINLGFDIFIEIGPGMVLSKLLKKIDKSKKSLNVEDSISLQNALEVINNEA